MAAAAWIRRSFAAGRSGILVIYTVRQRRLSCQTLCWKSGWYCLLLNFQNSKTLAEQFSFSQPASAQALKQQLESGIREARKLFATENQSVQLRQANFDVLAKGVCRIWILQDAQAWTSAEIAMTRLGERLQSYRSEIDINQRRIFGLPLPPKFFKERRSSPLLLRVTELQGNKYVGIAVLFKTSGKDIRVGDYAVIERWVEKFQGKLEVTL